MDMSAEKDVAPEVPEDAKAVAPEAPEDAKAVAPEAPEDAKAVAPEAPEDAKARLRAALDRKQQAAHRSEEARRTPGGPPRNGGQPAACGQGPRENGPSRPRAPRVRQPSRPRAPRVRHPSRHSCPFPPSLPRRRRRSVNSLRPVTATGQHIPRGAATHRRGRNRTRSAIKGRATGE